MMMLHSENVKLATQPCSKKTLKGYVFQTWDVAKFFNFKETVWFSSRFMDALYKECTQSNKMLEAFYIQNAILGYIHVIFSTITIETCHLVVFSFSFF